MRTMRFWIGALLILALACTAWGQAGLKRYNFTLVDEFGSVVTDACAWTIYAAGGSSVTVYSDPAGSSSTTFTADDDGNIAFWYAESTCDVGVTNSVTGGAIKRSTVAPDDHRIMLARNEQVLSATTYTGTVVGVAGTWTGTQTWGVDATGVDTQWYGDTASNSMLWDYSQDRLELTAADVLFDDDSDIIIGSGSDFVIDSDTAATLDIIAAVTDETAAVNLGLDEAGMDLNVFGTTSGDGIFWDASADSLTLTHDFTLFSCAEAAANQFKVDATGTVAGNAIVLETTDGGIQLNADGAANGDITIDARGTIATVGAVIQDGRKVENHSANHTLTTPTDIGTLITVDTAAVVIKLPAVGAGATYTIMNIGADGTEIHVDPDDADKFCGGCGFAGALDDGDKLTNTGATANKGDYVKIGYFDATGWYIVEMVGIWADGG